MLKQEKSKFLRKKLNGHTDFQAGGMAVVLIAGCYCDNHYDCDDGHAVMLRCTFRGQMAEVSVIICVCSSCRAQGAQAWRRLTMIRAAFLRVTFSGSDAHALCHSGKLHPLPTAH